MNDTSRSELYVVATPPLWRRMDRAPLGVPIKKSNWFDPTLRKSELFIDHLDWLDADTFGPLGMRMPRWALYDCAALPGAIIGLGEAIGGVMQPRSMCLLTPRLGPDEWLAYSISSHPFDPALEVETLALSIAAVGAKRVLATAQWASHHLDVHARFGPLELLAAWIPAHTSPRSFVYAFDVTRERLVAARAKKAEAPADATLVDAADEALLRSLQARIEAGTRLELVGTRGDAGAERALVREVRP
jgi:hypothetical protein